MYELVIVNILVLALQAVSAMPRWTYNVVMWWPRGVAAKFKALADYPEQVRLARHDTLMARIPRGLLDGQVAVTARGLNFRVPALSVVDGGQSIH